MATADAARSALVGSGTAIDGPRRRGSPRIAEGPLTAKVAAMLGSRRGDLVLPATRTGARSLPALGTSR